MSHRRSRPHRKIPKPEERREPFFHQSLTRDRHFFSPATAPALQAKLKIGKPGDRFEREADRVADSIVSGSVNPPLQQKPDGTLQRQTQPEEEETAQTQLQTQPEEEEETAQTQLQTQMEEEEETAQTQLQTQMEEEETAQTKSESGTPNSTSALADRIRRTKGSGNPLPDRIRAEMETHFGKDFSMVRIHTDEDAVSMNRQLKSQAFAQGKDLYFNQGKFAPYSQDGKRLLAHELAHVVQQNQVEPKAPSRGNPTSNPSA